VFRTSGIREKREGLLPVTGLAPPPTITKGPARFSFALFTNPHPRSSRYFLLPNAARSGCGPWAL
jgi:hypothetical protein